jgi:AraC-like DNA-binding protein
MVIFRPEFLESGALSTASSVHESAQQLSDLNVYRVLRGSERTAVEQHLERMAADTQLRTHRDTLSPLLRHQLLALLTRLLIIQSASGSVQNTAPGSLQRFKRFRRALEQDFRHRHQVGAYANLLGYSQKSLQRAALEVAGLGAKAFVAQRIALEAKRLLVHTGQPVAVIANALGFDEPTNFVKFFRREVGIPPGEFRRRQAMTS